MNVIGRNSNYTKQNIKVDMTHQVVLVAIINLEALITKGEEFDEAAFFQTVPNIIIFLKQFADRYYHVNSQLIIENTINDENSSLRSNPIIDLLHESTLSRMSLMKMQKGLELKVTAEVCKGIRDYFDALSLHKFIDSDANKLLQRKLQVQSSNLVKINTLNLSAYFDIINGFFSEKLN